MHKFRRSFFSTVLLVTAALPSNGQSSAIEGSVADPSGRPIRGARVECSGATVFTSLDGQFRFPGVSRCDATVSSQGFEPRQLEMAAGVPVVATDIPGTRDLVVHGETGYLVPTEGRPVFAPAVNASVAKGLARYTNTLLDDPALARRLDLTVLTTDRDFETLPDIKSENWTGR